jgi:DNA (cytosine-5)-methyltransferase 1
MVALFAGGGGLHLGFAQAGFRTLLATDVEPTSAETFRLNHPDIKFHCGDIRHLTRSEAVGAIGEDAVDVMVGGPPCQGFSTLGDQLQGDPRNAFFEAYARLVRWTNPRCVLIENTSYLRTQYEGQYEIEIKEALTRLGYRVCVAVLNAADFGVPQVRKRVFFVATREDAAFAWPKPTRGNGRGLLPYLTVGDAIMDIVDESRCSSLANHDVLNHGHVVVERYKLIPEGGRLPPPQLLPEGIRRRNFGNTYKRLHRNRPSLTLVPGNNAFPVHPVANRSLTPREAARLQTFPDRYVFAGGRAQQCRLVGNAVPVVLANCLAKAIKAHLEGRVSGNDDKALPARQNELLFYAGTNGTSGRRRRGPTAASFFTGAGGLQLGFARAGYKLLGSFDKKSIVARNSELNFPSIPHYKVDLTECSTDDVKRMLGASKVDVVFGGPPCQGFSIFGNRRFINTKGHDAAADERNALTFKFVQLALALKPRVIMMENVPGMASMAWRQGTYVDAVAARLKRAGFAVEYRVISCADYGAPQLRKRLVLVALEPGLEFSWPEAKYFAAPESWQRAHATVADSIRDLADPTTYSAEFSHVPMNHKPRLVERYKLIPEGGKLPEDKLPARLRKGYRTESVKNFSHVYRRLAWDEPARTMVPGHNAFPVHPSLPRTLTVREAARIQTFPDSFRFVGTRQQQCILVGNAVPPVIGQLFAQRILKAIRGNSKRPGYKADHYELTTRG